MNGLKLKCSLYSFLLYHILIFVIKCDGCYQSGLLCPKCNLTWQSYCTYEFYLPSPNLIRFYIDPDYWKDQDDNQTITITYNDTTKNNEIVLTLQSIHRFTNYHYIGSVGRFYVYTQELPVNITNTSINITFDNGWGNACQHPEQLKFVKLNESYGKIYLAEEYSTIFYHPKVQLNTANSCSSMNSIEEQNSDEYLVEAKGLLKNNSHLDYIDFERFSRYMIFDGFGKEMIFLGSLFDFLFYRNETIRNGNHQKLMISKSGILSIIFIDYNTTCDPAAYYGYYGDSMMIISLEHLFPNETEMILQNTFYNQDALLIANDYPDGVVYHLIQNCQTISPSFSDCQMTFRSIYPTGDVTLLSGCSLSPNNIIQDFNGDLLPGNAFSNVRIRGKCFTIYLKTQISSIQFKFEDEYTTLTEEKLDMPTEHVITTYNYPYLFSEIGLRSDYSLATDDKMRNNDDDLMFFIQFMVESYDESDCVQVTFLHTLGGSNEDGSTCDKFRRNGSAICQGIDIQLTASDNSTGILLRFRIEFMPNVTQPTQNPTQPTQKPIQSTSWHDNPFDKTKFILIVVLSAVGGVLIISIIIFIICYVNRRRIPILRSMTEQQAESNEYATDPTQVRDPWIVKSTDVEIDEEKSLGKGAFSEVFLGVLNGSVPLFQINQSIEVQLYSSKTTNICEIAVKRLLGHASDSDRLDFFKEIEIMKKLEYNLHIVSMYGYVASRFVPLMLLEYCELGDIRHYVADNEESLKKNQNGIKELTSYAWQICDGMSYIASKDIVHRDLAARNVLLTKSKVAKICDFGLAIQGNATINPMTKGLLPLKWLAPECYTENTFSTKSDVWSYGVTLFEIYSLGQLPYQDIFTADLLDFLQEGNRLYQPELCSDEIYHILRQYWCLNPNDRPSFDSLKMDISKCLVVYTGTYGYLSLPSQTS